MSDLKRLRELLERLQSGHFVRRSNLNADLFELACRFEQFVEIAKPSGHPRAVRINELGRELLTLIRERDAGLDHITDSCFNCPLDPATCGCGLHGGCDRDSCPCRKAVSAWLLRWAGPTPATDCGTATAVAAADETA